MDLYTGSSLTITAPVTEPSSELDLSSLSVAGHVGRGPQITTDTAAYRFRRLRHDAYFGGKMLYRAANLLTLAEQVGVTDAAEHAPCRYHR